MRSHADVVVIGAGPAGFAAATRAAELGAHVTLVERERLGGTCVNRGCMPALALLKAAEVLATIADARRHGIHVAGHTLDLALLRERQEMQVAALRSSMEAALQAQEIELVPGEARLAGPNSVMVSGEQGGTITARAIILAAGATSVRPAIGGATGPGVIDPEEALWVTAAPRSLAVVGATPIGLALARIYRALGSEVTLLEEGGQVLPGEDVDVADFLAQELETAGVAIQYGAQVQHIGDGPGGGRAVRIASAAGVSELAAEKIVFAGPRRPLRYGLGLDAAGVQTAGGAIAVDDRMQTNVPGIFAAGDAIGGALLSHVATAEGRVAAENALGQASRMRYKLVPRCVYTLPEAAAIGLTAEEAERGGRAVRVGLAWFASNPRAAMAGESGGLVKLVADARFGEILGVHVIGRRAHELITTAALAMRVEATAGDLAGLLYPHPVFGEALQEAARACR